MRFLLFISAIFATAAAFSNVRIRMESEVNKFTSSFWKFEGRAVETESVEAIFALARDPAVVSKLEATLYDLSTPSSPNYGKWLTKDQLIEQFAPPKDYAQVVMDFLASYGLAGRVSELGDKVFVKIPAHLANDMFQTEFGRFRSVDDDKVVLLRVTKVTEFDLLCFLLYDSKFSS